MKQRRQGRIPRIAGIAIALVGLAVVAAEGELTDAGAVLEAIGSAFLAVGATKGRCRGRREVFDLEKRGLTAREAEFTRLLLAGKTMKEIALDSGVTSSTVRNAMSSVYAKLGISGLGELHEIGATYTVV